MQDSRKHFAHSNFFKGMIAFLNRLYPSLNLNGTSYHTRGRVFTNRSRTNCTEAELYIH